jgi:hypothetical protein
MAPILLPHAGGMFKDMKEGSKNLITEARVTQNFAMLGQPVSKLLDGLGLHRCVVSAAHAGGV